MNQYPATLRFLRLCRIATGFQGEKPLADLAEMLAQHEPGLMAEAEAYLAQYSPVEVMEIVAVSMRWGYPDQMPQILRDTFEQIGDHT